jgi:flagellin-specific chaperone FliS
MSDLTSIAENIQETMQTLERTQEAGNGLREQVTRENYANFRRQMDELYQRLRKLNSMLLHEDEVALDELGDALSRAFEGQPAEYRRASGHGNG